MTTEDKSPAKKPRCDSARCAPRRGFPVLLASAFSPMPRAAWRRVLIAAEAAGDLDAEDALRTRWERQVVAPLARRYRLDQRSLF